MAGAFSLRKLSDIGPVVGPAESGQLPDLGFGPMTPDSIAGNGAPGEISATEPHPLLAKLLALAEAPARQTAHDFGKASSSVADTLADPSLENATAAGINTGSALMDVLPMSKAGPLAVAGSALSGATLKGLETARDLLASSAEAKKRAKSEPLPEDAERITAQQAPASDPVLDKIKDDPQLVALYGQIKQAQVDATRDYPGRNGDQSRAAAAGRLDKLQGQLNEAMTKREAGKQKIFDQQVANANEARAGAMANNDRFSNTFAGKVYAKTGLGPFLAAAIPSSIVSLAKGPAKGVPSWLGRAGMSTAAGAAAANAPAGYDVAFAPAANPEKEAMRRYAYELPDSHPDKAKAKAYAESLPDENPVHAAARAEFGDMGEVAKKSIFGGMEGFLGGEVGDLAPSALGGLIRRKTYGFEPKPSSPALADRVEPTFSGAFQGDLPPWSEAAQKSAVAPAPMKDVSSVMSQAPALPQGLPMSKKAQTAIDAMRSPNPAKASKAVDAVLAKADAQDLKAKQDALVKSVMQVRPAGVKVSDVRQLLKANPELAKPEDVIRALTKKSLELQKQPGSMSAALEDRFGKTDSGADLLTRGQ